MSSRSSSNMNQTNSSSESHHNLRPHNYQQRHPPHFWRDFDPVQWCWFENCVYRAVNFDTFSSIFVSLSVFSIPMKRHTFFCHDSMLGSANSDCRFHRIPEFGVALSREYYHYQSRRCAKGCAHQQTSAPTRHKLWRWVEGWSERACTRMYANVRHRAPRARGASIAFIRVLSRVHSIDAHRYSLLIIAQSLHSRRCSSLWRSRGNKMKMSIVVV